MQALTGFVLSMSVTMMLIPLLKRWAVPLRILDMPEARKVHTSPVPRVGGIAMAAGTLLALILGGVSGRPMQVLCLGIAVLLVFGVWDDRRALSAAPKFIGQALAALIAIVWGGVNVGTLTLSERMPLPPWLSIPLTFCFLVGGTNAFNLADGLDGLAGGMATLCLCGTALLAYTVGNAAVGGAAVIIVGALIGFLRFNTHPARIFMGDGGSQVLGFSAALLALFLTQDPRIPLSTALPLLLLGMPIVDTLMVMIERVLSGSSPFVADRRHIHHRLLALGFEHWEAVSILYVLQGCLFIVAWYTRYDSDLWVGGSFVAFALMVVGSVRLAQYLDWRARSPSNRRHESTGSRRGETGSGTSRATTLRSAIRSLGGILLQLVLVLYAIWVLTTGSRLSRDVQMLALSLSALLAAGLVLRWRQTEAGWTDKAALYSCAALAIFVTRHGLPWAPALSQGALHTSLVEYCLYITLAMALVISIRGSPDGPFRITPLDLLVLLVVVTVPNLPDSIIASARSLGVTIAESALVFYSVEALSVTAGRSWRWLSGGAAIFLLGLALRPGP